jgi:hypothetical protein
MPPNHREYINWNGERFVKWADKIGVKTGIVARYFLSCHKVEQQGYKACMALLKLSDRYLPKRLEAACARVLEFTERPSFKSVQAILKSGQDRLQTHEPASVESTSVHGFTRGASYYKRGDQDAE